MQCMWYRIQSEVPKHNFTNRLSTCGYFKGNSLTSEVFSGRVHRGEQEHSQGNSYRE